METPPQACLDAYGSKQTIRHAHADTRSHSFLQSPILVTQRLMNGH